MLTNDSDFVERDDQAGVLYYDDQSTSRRELVGAIRVVDDLFADTDLVGRTIYLPDDWI